MRLASAAEDEAMFGHLFEESRGGDEEGWSEEDESAESGPEDGEQDELAGVFDTSSSEVSCMAAAGVGRGTRNPLRRGRGPA